jgi:hypothetical protein
LKALGVLLVAAFTCGVARARADDDRPFVVNVRLQIDRSIASGVLEAELKDETDSLWKPYGIRLEWTAADSAVTTRGLSLDATVLPSIEAAHMRPSGTVLGRAFVVEGVVTTVQPIHLSFDATERALAVRPITGLSTVRIAHQREMSRALGRVLAHEIGHVLLGAHHERAGLMRAVFRPFELADARRTPFRLTCTSAVRLKHQIQTLSERGRGALERARCLAGSTDGRICPGTRATGHPGRPRRNQLLERRAVVVQ